MWNPRKSASCLKSTYHHLSMLLSSKWDHPYDVEFLKALKVSKTCRYLTALDQRKIFFPLALTHAGKSQNATGVFMAVRMNLLVKKRKKLEEHVATSWYALIHFLVTVVPCPDLRAIGMMKELELDCFLTCWFNRCVTAIWHIVKQGQSLSSGSCMFALLGNASATQT